MTDKEIKRARAKITVILSKNWSKEAKGYFLPLANALTKSLDALEETRAELVLETENADLRENLAREARLAEKANAELLEKLKLPKLDRLAEKIADKVEARLYRQIHTEERCDALEAENADLREKLVRAERLSRQSTIERNDEAERGNAELLEKLRLPNFDRLADTIADDVEARLEGFFYRLIEQYDFKLNPEITKREKPKE